MKAEQLWASILQEAIQGKLVPQLESEPKVDKVQEIPEDVPFNIPEKWTWIQLGELVNYGSSRQIKGSKITSSTWVLDLEDIEKNSGKLLQKKYGTKTTSNKSCFKKGDVLYGKLRPYLNKVLIADEDGCCSTEIVPINVSSTKLKIDAEFLSYFLRSPYFVGYANSCAYGVKMPRLGTKDAKSAWVAIPPITEQRRIVARLQKIRSLVDTYCHEEIHLSQLITEFPDKLKASILQEAIQGRLVPQLESEPEVDITGEEPQSIPFNAPEKWKWVKFSNVARLLNGRAYARSELLNKAPGRVPVLRVGNFFTNGSWYYSDLELEPNKYCDDNDLLFAWSASFGPKIWNGGRCIYHYHIWKVICSEYVDKEWLYFWLLSMAEKLKSTSGRGSTMIHITKKETEQVPLALPPIEEQRRIVKTLKLLFGYIDNIKAL